MTSQDDYDAVALWRTRLLESVSRYGALSLEHGHAVAFGTEEIIQAARAARLEAFKGIVEMAHQLPKESA